MEEIKWGILGCADIAKTALIPAILKEKNSKLYAVASRKIEKARDFADRFGVEKYYDSYQKLLENDEIDAVYLPLPNSIHKEWTIRAAEHKKNILCEKPLALNHKAALEMIEAAEKHQVLLMEAFMYRFHPLVKKIKEIVTSGVLGKLKYISANFCFNTARPDSDIRFSKELGGGALYDLGCYTINAARYFAGSEPEEVYNSFIVRPGTDVDNRGLAVLRFPDGILASINYSMGHYDQKHVEIAGEEGKLTAAGIFEWTGAEDKYLYLEKDGEVEKIRVKGREQYLCEVEAFVRAINENNKAPLDPRQDALNNMKVIDAMFESARRNIPVKII